MSNDATYGQINNNFTAGVVRSTYKITNPKYIAANACSAAAHPLQTLDRIHINGRDALNGVMGIADKIRNKEYGVIARGAGYAAGSVAQAYLLGKGIEKSGDLISKKKTLYSNKMENVLNEEVFTRYMSDGREVTDFSHLPGELGIEIPGRLSVDEMTYLTQEYGVEFAQVYQYGPGTNVGGGNYYIYSGDVSSIKIPLKKDIMFINHNHPGGTAYPSSNNMQVLSYYSQLGAPQKISEIIPVGKTGTVKFGVNGIK